MDQAEAEPAPRRPQFTLQVRWRANGQVHEEMFGPWEADDELAHHAELSGFLARWTHETGVHPDAATIWLVQDPAGWLADRAARAEASGRRIDAGFCSPDEFRRLHGLDT